MTGLGQDPLQDPALAERLGEALRDALARQHVDRELVDQLDVEHVAAELLGTAVMRDLVTDLERHYRGGALFAFAEECELIATQIEDILARFPREQTTDLDMRDPTVWHLAAAKARGFYLDQEQRNDPTSAWHLTHDTDPSDER